MLQIVEGINKLLKLLGGIMLASLIVIIFSQVVSRYIFHSAMSWPEETAKYLFIGLAYAGATLTMFHNKNLRVDALLTITNPKITHLLNIFTQATTVGYCILAAYFTFDMMLEVKDMGQMAAAVEIPVWPTWIPIPVGFSLMALYALLNCIVLISGKEK